MEEIPQKLFRLPGTIEEEEEREQQAEVQATPIIVENPARADSPLLGLGPKGTLSSLPRNLTLVRVSTQSSSIGGVVRQDSTRSRYRAGPTRKLRRRAVLKNGECNVLQSRISRRSLRFLQDIFTTLVDTQWRWTLLCFTLSFLLSWLGFAVIWWLIAFTHGDFEERHLPPFQVESNWTPCIYNIFSFTSCFLFSIETQHTIGYGSRSTTEECPEAIFVMCIQSIAGVMIQAFMVGIVFAKMSRPKQRTQTLLFSRNAVICQRDGELCLMFRVGDMRKSHIIGAAVRAQVIRTRTTKEGEILSQNQQELAVGTDGQNENLFFIWPTTIVHKINSDSPFHNMSAEDMLTERFEVVVILEGTIESTGQTTQARSSYLPQEILWGHRFEPMVSYSKERQGYEVDYSLFNSTTQVDTPLCSGRELAEFYRVQDELRHGTGMITSEDTWTDGYCCCCGHRRLVIPNHFHRHSSIQTDSIKSDNSTEDSVPSRNAYKDPTYGVQESIPIPKIGQIFDVDPNDIQEMAEVDPKQLPQAINPEILRNSREIMSERMNEDPESARRELRELSFLKLNGTRRNPAKRPFLEEDRWLSNGSGKRLHITIGNRIALPEEDKRLSCNRSNGAKKPVVLAIDRLRNKPSLSETENRENLICSRRHTGSRERLNVIRRNVCAKGSKETPDLRTRRKLHFEDHERISIEREKSSKISFSPSLPRMTSSQNCGIRSESPTDSNSPYDKSPEIPIPSEYSRSLTSAISDLSPESGFYEGNRSSSSAETIRKDLRFPEDLRNSVITRNRKSYEDAQLQDVNRNFSRQNSASSSSDGDSTVANLINNIVIPVPIAKDQPSPVILRQIPCTNV